MFFSILFRKYPLFRTLFYAFLIVIALLIITVVTTKAKKVPIIEKINPSVGSAGDTMIIDGQNFGDFRETSYVEIGGSRITASGYVEWSDNLVKIIIPSNVQDGLVFVVTKSGKSKPSFFANESGIPVAAHYDTKTSLPVITSISPTSLSVGEVVTISGSNFGSIRNDSSILFTANRTSISSGDKNVLNVSASSADFDYESWSDSEIRVRVPDGAMSGAIFVKTDKGISISKQIDIKTPIGKKSFVEGKTYAIELNEDIDSIASANSTNIMLRVPRPIISASQPVVELNDCNPEPIIPDFKNTVIHKIELQKSTNPNDISKKIRFTQQFIVTAYAVKSEINPKNIKSYDKDRILYKENTISDSLINCDDEELTEFAKNIVKKEKNPYLQAKMIYNYMIEHFMLFSTLRNSNESSTELIRTKKGDAYDFSLVYTALLRSLGIPAISVAGVIVDSDSNTKNHWWNEFYIENYGWVPVDVSLGIGMRFDLFKSIPDNDTKEYYFGNLDNQHIAFSRGLNKIKQSLVNGKIVYRPRSFAFQSIWEESSEGSVNYSSLWNDPIVTGIY